MNVLVMSISRKVPLLKAVNKAMSRVAPEALLIGADTDHGCIGQFFTDRFWECPPLRSLEVEQVIHYCEDNQVSILFPTRDGELAYFAEHRETLLQHGIHAMISDPAAVRLSLDKQRFSDQLLERGYPVIPSSGRLDFESDYYVVKERFGAGSVSAGIGLTYEEAERHALQLQEPIFQPYIQGSESSIDCYIDFTGRVKGVIARRRDQIVRGESQVTTSYRDPRLEELCRQIGEMGGFRGHIMFQVMIDECNEPHLIECNCRFGGASTLSVALGLDSFAWFISESRGMDAATLPFHRADDEKTLIRYAEDWIQ